MTADDFDQLWETAALGPGGWWARGANLEQKQWVEEIAARIRERGSNPTWAQVHRVFCQKWPDDHHPVAGTLRDAILSRVE